MKILIKLPSWLGDVVMATPAIENLINHYNDAEINIIGSNRNLIYFGFLFDLYSGSKMVDNTIERISASNYNQLLESGICLPENIDKNL